MGEECKGRQEEMTGRCKESDLLNDALICSKPISVLDELDHFWEKNDASKGITPRGILAEHIMEKQAIELLNGTQAKGKGAFCV